MRAATSKGYLPVTAGDVAWQQQTRSDFARKVWGIVSVQALVTLVLASLPTAVPAVQRFVLSHAWLAYVAIFAPLALMFVMLAVRHRYPLNYAVLSAFTLAQAYSLGIVALSFAPDTVLVALAMTAACLGALTGVAFAMRHRDLSFFGLGVMVCGYGLLLALVIMSVSSPAIKGSSVAVGAGGAMLFSCYVVFDTWLMLSPWRGMPVDEYMLAAMNLWLDVINLFVFMLQCLSGQADN